MKTGCGMSPKYLLPRSVVDNRQDKMALAAISVSPGEELPGAWAAVAPMFTVADGEGECIVPQEGSRGEGDCTVPQGRVHHVVEKRLRGFDNT